MLRFVLLAALLLSSSSTPGGDQRRKVVVVVSGIAHAKGQLHVNLCRETEFLTPACYRRAALRVSSVDPMRFAFADVAPGVYAVQVIHDLNENGRFDRTLYGAPAEPNGVSRNPNVTMRAPTFSEAAVHLDGSAILIQVRIK